MKLFNIAVLLSVSSLLFCGNKVLAQSSAQFSLSGYVKDSASGETLMNATILISGGQIHTQTNVYGYYSAFLPRGKYLVVVSHTGYRSKEKEILINDNTTLHFNLSATTGQLQEVIVKTDKKLKRINTVALGVQQMDITQIKKIPAFMGEPDVLKAILTLPGITSAGDGAAGFNVRGGNVDENLILLDEAPVYNSFHMLGFFSVFNPDAVKNVTLYRSAFPAEYGGRISSVLDVRMKEGNNQKISVNGGISNIFSRLSVEAPIQKDKSSFIIAGRRSYIDVLAKPFFKKDSKDNQLYFYDLTAKANFKVNSKNTIYLSGYFGKDVFSFKNETTFKWGNSTGTLRWNHLFTPKLFLNTSFYYSKYDYSLQFQSPPEETKKQQYNWQANIQTYGIKPTLTWFLNKHHQLKTGVNVIYYNFYPGKGELNFDGIKNSIELENRYGSETGLFAEDSWKISQKWQLQSGVRFNRYAYLGNTTVYYFRDTLAGIRKPLENSSFVSSKTPVSTFNFIEPRVSLRYQANVNLHLKLGYSRSTQYIHLISSTASPTPVDIYLPSTNNIKPTVSDQYSAGIVSAPALLKLEMSAELFYKKMENLVDYINNANTDLNKLVEGELLSCKGKSYGLELEARKEAGIWQGWLNYTWSKSWRKTIGIGNNEWHPGRFDRPHVINACVIYDPGKRWQFSANFNFASGIPATFPDVRLDIQGLPIPYNSTVKRNNYRLPPYHRLDFAAKLKGKQNKKIKTEWVFGLYNVYNRQNAYSIYFKPNEDDPGKKEAVRLSVIGSVIPSVTLNFKF